MTASEEDSINLPLPYLNLLKINLPYSKLIGANLALGIRRLKSVAFMLLLTALLSSSIGHNDNSDFSSLTDVKTEICLATFSTDNSTDKIETVKKKGPTVLASVPFSNPLNMNTNRAGLTSRFGTRKHPVLKRVKHHDGVDLAMRRGAPVYSTVYGKVVDSKRERGYGNTIRIKSGEYEVTYAHLSSLDVKKGQIVSFGEKVGKVGSTGLTTGPHLHYEIRKNKKLVDPMPYIYGEY